MRNQIVEGEPGIFPDPIARVMRALVRLFQRKRADAPSKVEPPPEDELPPTSG
jgi:hypothetical protein